MEKTKQKQRPPKGSPVKGIITAKWLAQRNEEKKRGPRS